MDVYSAIEKTLLSAKMAVNTNDQKTPPVPPLISPGVKDLGDCQPGTASRNAVHRIDVRQRHLPARLDRRTGREHGPAAVYSLSGISKVQVIRQY